MPGALNVAGVLMMFTLISCVQRFPIHDLLLVVSSQHLCNVVFTGAPGVRDLRSAADTAEETISVFFDRAGDSTGGVKDEKGLSPACQSTGKSTGGRAHGPTAMLCFDSFEQSDFGSLAVIEMQKSRRNVSGGDRHETGCFRHSLGSWPL